MTAFTFFYGVSMFISGLICLAFGIFVISRSRGLSSQLYFYLTCALFWVALSKTFYISASTVDLARSWHILSMLGWFFFFSLFLHFIYLLANDKNPKYWPVLYLPALIMFPLYSFTPYFFTGFEKKYFGYLLQPGALAIGYLAYYLLFFLGGISLLVVTLLKGKEFYRRKQAGVVLMATLVPLVFGTLTGDILPLIGLAFPPLALQFIALTGGFIGYALLRYSPFIETTKEKIAEAAAVALQDGLILTDEKQIINYCNSTACKISGYRADELQGKHISFLIPNYSLNLTQLIDKNCKLVPLDMKIFPISSDRGYVYMARDLSGLTRSRSEIKTLFDQEQVLLKHEKLTSLFLSDLIGKKYLPEIESAWQNIKKENQEIADDILPAYELAKQHALVLEKAASARSELLKKRGELERFNELMKDRNEALKQLKIKLEKLTHE